MEHGIRAVPEGLLPLSAGDGTKGIGKIERGLVLIRMEPSRHAPPGDCRFWHASLFLQPLWEALRLVGDKALAKSCRRSMVNPVVREFAAKVVELGIALRAQCDANHAQVRAGLFDRCSLCGNGEPSGKLSTQEQRCLAAETIYRAGTWYANAAKLGLDIRVRS